MTARPNPAPHCDRSKPRPRFRRRIGRNTVRRVGLLLLALLWSQPQSLAGEVPSPAVFRNFDGPGVTWQLNGSRRDVRLVGQSCVDDDAREGTGCERVLLAAPGGESVELACPVGRVPVLDELTARLWVKANRPGVSLAARVVMPRSIDATTGRPKAIVVQGPQYDQVGRWQQLALANVPELLAGRVRVMRTVPGADVDPREAYVDAIVLVVPGGPGAAAVWTDALAVDGIVMSPPEEVAGVPGRVAPASHEAAAGSRGWRPDVAATSAPGARQAAMRLQGGTLMVFGKQFLPVGIQWNAEPLSYLADRGYNTVWIRQPPTPEETDMAARAGMWFVCPPPGPDAIAADGLRVSLDRVLAWYLGRPADHEIDYYQRWAELVRQNDPATGRPIVVAPRADWLPYSKVADILLAEHPAASRLSSADYTQWLAGVSLLARPGTPFWASVPTQPGQLAREQAAALLADRPVLAVVGDAQLDAIVRTAGVGGCRGFLFQSHTSLNLADDASKRRAAALELLNRELHLVDPWLTIGRNVGEVMSTDATTTVSVLQVERARLVVPMPRPSGTSEPADPTAARPPLPPGAATALALIVPGVPISNETYLLTPAGMRRLAAERVAGGMRVVVERDADAMVLMTDDPAVVGSFRQRVASGARQAAVLQRDLAAAAAKLVPDGNSMAASFADQRGPLVEATPSAREKIGQANSQLAAGNFDGAYQAASSARRILAEAAERQRRLLAAGPQLSSTPFDAAHVSIEDWVVFHQQLAQLRAGENLLYGGDFEDLGQLTEYGWQHISTPLPGVEPRAELSAAEPYLGRFALRLSAVAEPAGSAPQVVARPLVSIASPPIHVTKGQVLEISGWIRVPDSIVGSIDGLAIVDSLGGEELALRVRESPDWQPFRMIRGVPASTDLTVTFSLSGTGTALVDAVMVRPLSQASVRRLPEVTETAEPIAPQSAERPRPLFGPPGWR